MSYPYCDYCGMFCSDTICETCWKWGKHIDNTQTFINNKIYNSIMTESKKIPVSKIKKGDQVTWLSDYRNFGYVKRKFKANVSMPKQNNEFLPFPVRKGQELYELKNPNVGLTQTTIVPVSKIKHARRFI